MNLDQPSSHPSILLHSTKLTSTFQSPTRTSVYATSSLATDQRRTATPVPSPLFQQEKKNQEEKKIQASLLHCGQAAMTEDRSLLIIFLVSFVLVVGTGMIIGLILRRRALKRGDDSVLRTLSMSFCPFVHPVELSLFAMMTRTGLVA